MNSTETRALICAIAIVALLGCHGARTKAGVLPSTVPNNTSRPESVMGYFVHDDPEFYRAKSMKDVSSGRIMYLGIEEGRWLMHNASVAYGGTWVPSEGGAILTVTKGPGGTTSIVTKTAEGVTLSADVPSAPKMKLTFVADKAPADFGYEKFLGPQK